MTAETEVRNDLCEVSKGEIEEKCGSDMSSYQDLPPKVGADCNGSIKLVVDGDDGDDDGDDNVNINGSGKDDPDDSYVFISGTNEVTADLAHNDVTVIPNSKNCLIQGRELNLENGESVESSVVETNCIVHETANNEVSLEGSLCEPVREGVVVVRTDAVEDLNRMAPVEAETHHLDCGTKVEDQIESESAPNPKENQESQVNESAADAEESRGESIIISSLADDTLAKPVKQITIDSNVESGEASQNAILEADGCELPKVDFGEVRSEEEQPKLRLDIQVEESSESLVISAQVVESGEVDLEEKNTTDTDGVGESKESQVVVTGSVQSDLNPQDVAANETEAPPLEADGSSLPKVDVGEVRSEEQPILHLDLQLEGISESLIVSTKSVESGEEELEEKNTADTDTGVGENMESQVVVTDSVQSYLNPENDAANDTEAPPLEADRSSLPKVDVGEVRTKEQPILHLDIQVEGSSESLTISKKSIESGEEELEKKNTTDIDTGVGENMESQIVVNVQSDLNPEIDESHLANETEAPSETETVIDPVTGENRVSPTEEISRSICESQTGTQVCLSSNNAQILPSTDCARSESEIGDVAAENGGSFLAPDVDIIVQQEAGYGPSLMTENVPTFSTDDTERGTEIENLDIENNDCSLGCSPDATSESEAKNVHVGGDTKLNCPAECLSSETVIEFGSLGPHEKALISRCDDINMESEASTRGTEPVCGANHLDPEHIVNDSHRNGSPPDVKLEAEVESSSAITNIDLFSNGAVVPTSEILDGSVASIESALNCVPEILNGGIVGNQLNGNGITDGKLTCPETQDIDSVQRDGMPTSFPDGSASDGDNVEAEVLTRPYNFLIRIPRFDDEKLREQIKNAQLQVEEKTQRRDAIRVEIQTKRANCQAHGERFDTAKSEETAARRLVKLKRQEIDSVQSVINRVKNAISVEDIDGRIFNMEHMIAHETLELKEEKQFIREIKQLKQLRDQLYSNMGSQEEVQQALDQKDQTEERLKILKKELDSLKDTVSKAEAAAIAAGKKYEEESIRVKELQAQFRAADDIRQETYTYLLSLKRQLYEKNKNFRMYKDDARAASDLALHGDKEALHRLCFDQVETFMEQWNINDEFRKEYVRCNMSTGRRFRTLDGRALGPDEEPSVLPSYVDERVDRRLVSIPGQAKSISLVSTAEQEKLVSSTEDKQAHGKSKEKVPKQKSQTAKTVENVKPSLASGSTTVSGRDEIVEDRKEETNIQKKEQELTRKAEESRKEEIAAKLKEQRRLEEKAKAMEALERKKRNAEKAQVRAESRARKEAEQKEKEREKRLRKKEKRKASPGDDVNSNNGEDAPASECSPERTTKESEVVKESIHSTTTSKRPQKPSHWFAKQSKSKPIPPPLANRGKKRMQQWLRMIAAAAFVIALFLLGNTGFFLNLRVQKVGGGF